MNDSQTEYVMGIDEAGRGPVLGPMLYGACLCPISKLPDLKASGVFDSKQLTDAKRRKLFIDIQQSSYLEWIVDAIPADWMSSQMLAKNRYSLNEISHDSAIQMISYALRSGFNIKHVFLDTVGIPEAYEKKLGQYFTGYNMKFTVVPKADVLYPVVSAASICAKVTRDDIIHHWTFVEKCLENRKNICDKKQQKNKETAKEMKCDENEEDIDLNIDERVDGRLISSMMNVLGNGYPSDPTTKQWLKTNVDFIFGFARIVRFSWSTAKVIIDQQCAVVEWSDDIADNCLSKWGFGSVKNVTDVKRSNYFRNCNLKLCDSCPF